MTNEEIHAAVFKQVWRRCSLRLVNGDVITVDHPDYLLMPREKNWVLWVQPRGQGFQFVPTRHIAAIDLQTQPAS